VTLAGRLLVAAPPLVDPNFDRTVVLLLAHDSEEGSLGLVLNRPSGVAVAEYLESWSRLAIDPGEVFIGGPVQPEGVIGIGWVDGPMPDGMRAVTDGVAVVDLHLSPSELPGVTAVRLFAGHAGWAPGQLEAEIREGAWFTVDVLPGDLRSHQPGDLWRSVLHRQGGDLRALSHYPDDPSLN
jgi:putative transcriptional regulator